MTRSHGLMTAFSVRDGFKHRRFQWKRLCLGLASAPSLFQQIVEGLFKDMPEVLVYPDDIVIMSMNRDEHMKLLDVVLQRLSEAHLVLNPSKWVQSSVRSWVTRSNFKRYSPSQSMCRLCAAPHPPPPVLRMPGHLWVQCSGCTNTSLIAAWT